MANCDLITGYQIPTCNQGSGGVSRVWLGTWSGSSSYTLDATETITGMSGFNYAFEFQMDSENVTYNENETGIAPGANTGVFFTQELILVFNRNTAAIRSRVMMISQSKVYGVILDNNGIYWLVLEKGGRVSTGTGGFGKMLADPNSTSITISTNTPFKAYPIAAAALTSLGITL